MNGKQLSPSRRRDDVRVWWAQHLAAQRSSGRNQAAYCRARGLDPKYFTLWKRKLLALPVTPAVERPQLVPVTVRAERIKTARGTEGDRPLPTSFVALRLSLGNGMSLSLEVTIGVLPTLVRELAAVRC